ncbi:conserved hypothetical protein [Ricinus communis]|uniref:Uncharacterized protein n=1 Tax=Ricinus communis TaxID=3988 RepID=B9RPW9_RICCO|nr:conserved hypothetical protein [Ricinus communis]
MLFSWALSVEDELQLGPHALFQPPFISLGMSVVGAPPPRLTYRRGKAAAYST